MCASALAYNALRFPKPALQLEVVQQRSIHPDRRLIFPRKGKLRHQHPMKLAATLRQQMLERRAHRHLMLNVERVKLPQSLVVGPHRSMIRLQIQTDDFTQNFITTISCKERLSLAPREGHPR